jgi:hypothetical protein
MRLYKIEIIHRPELTRELHEEYEGDGHTTEYVTYHLADPKLRKEWEATGITGPDTHFHFFLPSETKLYRSRSSARAKQRIVERWGGMARILEAEVSEFIPSEDAKRKREIARLEERLEELKLREAVPF